MSVASALAHSNLLVDGPERALTAPRVERHERVLRLGLTLLVLIAPFEALRPLVRVPGQSFTTVETVLLAVLGVLAWTVWRTSRVRWAASTLLPWTALVGAGAMSSAAAPEFRANALHMTARFALAGAVWIATVTAASSARGRRQIVVASVASGTIVAAVTVADFAGVPFVAGILAMFRESVAVVGAQVRASGPFQYPTITSMYLEITFALGLGLIAAERDRQSPYVIGGVVIATALMAEAIVLTFTRAGLITMALSLGLVGSVEWRRHRWTRPTIGLGVLAILVALELLSSRSIEMWQLRLTTEGQGRWFSALIDAPETLTLDTTRAISVPVTVTNTGRATWDSYAAEPVRLSYHWIAADSDDVVAWNGLRTMFPAPVRPGRQVSLDAQVDAPGRPGHFRLMWDIEQEHRLWFSSEPDAVVSFTTADISGPVTSVPVRSGPLRIPKMAVRPGRFVLWGAAWRMFRERPLLGVGPDNYRLLYGRYSTVRDADPRVHSNNMYLEVIAGMGLAGLCAAIWIGVRVSQDARNAARDDRAGIGIAAACLAIAAHAMVDAFLAFTGTYILIAVTLGLAAGSERNSGHAHRI